MAQSNNFVPSQKNAPSKKYLKQVSKQKNLTTPISASNAENPQSACFQKYNETFRQPLCSLLQKISHNQHTHLMATTNQLALLRVKKEEQLNKRFYKDVYQKHMFKPGDAVLRVFSSEEKPRGIHVGDRYLEGRDKAKLLFSQRAFCKKRNVVAGKQLKRAYTESKDEKQDWISRKYSQYDRICTQQSGAMRMFMKRKHDIQCDYTVKKPIYGGSVHNNNSNTKNLFSVVQTNNNDFYPDASSTSLRMKQTFSTSTNTFKIKKLDRSKPSLRQRSLNKAQTQQYLNYPQSHMKTQPSLALSMNKIANYDQSVQSTQDYSTAKRSLIFKVKPSYNYSSIKGSNNRGKNNLNAVIEMKTKMRRISTDFS